MHTEPATAPPAHPGTARSVLRKMMSALHGDKYMVGAYPPDWPASSSRPTEVAHTPTPSKGR
jgi:hypothetical protein